MKDTFVFLFPPLIVSLVISMFYFYPSTTQALLSIYKCITVDQSGLPTTAPITVGHYDFGAGPWAH